MMNKYNFAYFPKQDSALIHAKAHPGYRVFVRESFSTDPRRKSCRQFISAELHKFLLTYFDVEDELKNFYEVIIVNHPCRLYFDLEFDRALNIDLDDDEVLDAFISLVIHCLAVKFNVICEPDCVLLLESTQNTTSPPPKKMSHHAIFHLPHHVFANNEVCGNFVKSIWGCLEAYLSQRIPSHFFPHPSLSVEQLRNLSVSCGKKNVFVADTSVYSRNRQFRLMGSRKWDAETFLAISSRSLYAITTSPIMALEKSLVCCDVSSSVSLLQWTDDNPAVLPVQSPSSANQSSSCHGAHRGRDLDGVISGQALASLRNFVTSCAAQHASHATVSVAKIERHLVKFHVDGSKWCEVVGREHRNNNVYYVAYLRDRFVRQGCYDLDCASKSKDRSKIKLPDDIIL